MQLQSKIPVKKTKIIVCICLIVLIVVCSVLSNKEISKHKNDSSQNVSDDINIQKKTTTETSELQEKKLDIFVPSTDDKTVDVSSDNNIVSQYAVLVNADDGTIIASKNANEKMYPASMTKVMTLLVAAEKLNNESLDQKIEISIEATDYSFENDCSAAGFLVGEKVTIEDLLNGIILPSGAEAAYQAAIMTSGTLEQFVDDMNKKVQELGISQTTHFSNPVGIFDENNYSTACDMAVILHAAMENEICKKVLSARNYTTSCTQQHPQGITFSSKFLNRIDRKFGKGKVVGAKTGYVNQSRYCAVSMYESEANNKYICVTGMAGKAWQTVYDHIAFYQNYCK